MALPSRRQFLTLAAASVPLGVAGCSSSGESGTQSRPTKPSRTPTSTTVQTPAPTDTENGTASPAPSCPEDVEAFAPWWVVAGGGPLGGFELTASPAKLEHGSTLTVTLRNVTDDTQVSGNRRKFDIQYNGPDGWHTIFGTEGEPAWYDIAINHEPGRAFQWSFEMSRPGLTRFLEGFERSIYTLCSPVEAGEYRFVYWGITSQRERAEDFETDYALGIPFEVT